MTTRRGLCRVIVLTSALYSFAVGFSISYKSTSGGTKLANKENDFYEEDVAPSSRKRSGRIRPKRVSAISARTEARKAQAEARHAEALKDPTLLTNDVFAERTDLHPSTKRALTETMGLKQMTEIQSKTYAAACSGQSVLGRARTGTGKTLAYLIPALERLLRGDRDLYHPGRNVGVLVVAPTRELAIQIADEARALLTFHSKDLSVMAVYGGSKMRRDTVLLNKRLPTVLVATPGRLLDHCQETRVGGRRFSDVIRLTRIVVLDETDRLLDMGFQKDIGKILSYLPRPEKRQTLMFSATIPKRLRSVIREALSDDSVEVDCVKDGATGNTSTNIRVNESFMVLQDMKDYVVKLIEIVRSAMRREDDYKVLVFFPTTRLVRFFADLFNDDLDIPVLQLHSRMTQSARYRASSDFRGSKRSVLFTSDVSARGVDYPEVTHVIQCGSADSKVTYTHRLGRTARAGRSGEGLVVLLPFETKLIDGLRRNGAVEKDYLEWFGTEDEAREMLVPVRHQIQSGNPKLTKIAGDAYKSFLAHYMSRVQALGVSRLAVVQCADQFADSIGLVNLPSFSEKMARKLNLEGIQGVSIDKDEMKH